MNKKLGISTIVAVAIAILCIIIGFFVGIFTVSIPTTTVTQTFVKTEVITGPTITIPTSIIITETVTASLQMTPTIPSEFLYKLGEEIIVDNWQIIVSEAKRVDKIIKIALIDPTYGDLYEPKKANHDFLIAKFLVKNIGKKVESVSEIWNFSVITTEGYVYGEARFEDLNSIEYGKIDELSKKYPQILIIKELSPFEKLDPEETIERWIIFLLPKDKIAKEITFNVGIIFGKIIHIEL